MSDDIQQKKPTDGPQLSSVRITDDDNGFIGITEAAKLAGVSRQTMHRWAHVDRILKLYKTVSGLPKLRKSEVRKMVSNSGLGSNPKPAG